MNEERIGTDDWVASYENRLTRIQGPLNRVTAFANRIPAALWLLLAALLPLASGDAYLIRIGGSIALTIMLGVGLNIVTGYAGLLDLGYIAFYGAGAYLYAYLSSDFTSLHIPVFFSLPLIALVCVLIGALLGSVALRLSGDYLAIATLGFGLMFVQLITNLNRVHLPGHSSPVDLTGGPNGIVRLDGLNLGISEINSIPTLYAVMTIVMGLLLFTVYRIKESPVGRGWRALREDSLAASAMGIPVQRLKLLAFSLGAGIAGMTGAFFAIWQGAVFPSNFELASLITLYGVIVLGGLGSLRGVVIGAVLIVVLPELLRQPHLANVLFYGAAVVLTASLCKPHWQVILPLGAMALVSVVVTSLEPSDTLLTTGNMAFAGLVISLLMLLRVRRRLGLLTLVVVLGVVAWHLRLLPEPNITRFIVLGALLIGVMIYRPNGIFGEDRVEVL